jgi:hypothetical protein
MTPEAIGTDSQICEEETATMQPKSTEDVDQEAVEAGTCAAGGVCCNG